MHLAVILIYFSFKVDLDLHKMIKSSSEDFFIYLSVNPLTKMCEIKEKKCLQTWKQFLYLHTAIRNLLPFRVSGGDTQAANEGRL